MSFARAQTDGRSAIESTKDKIRPSWESSFTASASRLPHPSLHMQTSNPNQLRDPMDPESSDSDVSVSAADRYRSGSPLAIPMPLPSSIGKQMLESSEAVQNRLRELARIEDHNIKKQERLSAKRYRKDERIAKKREVQDRRIKAIMDARERRDTRINIRRAREDAAFRKSDELLEEEEMSLRRRLKRLKRGLPPDDSPQLGRSVSSLSMSPPGPAFSTVPPPAKRHQSGPPGQQDGVRSVVRAPAHSPVGLHQSPSSNKGPQGPPYSFYSSNSNQSPYSVPYHTTPPVSASSHSTPAATLGPSGRPISVNSTERNTANGHTSSPVTRTTMSAPVHASSPITTAPLRQTTSNYDTRPPPPSSSTSSSGFASINAPPASGFAAINPRSVETPPISHTSSGQSEGDPRSTPIGPRIGEPGPLYNTTPNNGNMGSAPGTGKRTPSTTHPYQMSEAFANRHHHCERVDSLNRGIWTSYGSMGTQEAPTGPPVEMYLRCNHDDCKRIDWRTVHGLQCHIVKNHEQPKGTIGSLEKALDKYGVPVKEVEDYEREHGEGTAGTMADPKNLKIKTKTREASASRAPPMKSGPQSVDPTSRPAGYKPSPTPTLESPKVAMPNGISPAVNAAAQGPPPTVSHNTPKDASKGNTPLSANGPVSRFEPVRPGWRLVGASLPQTPTHGPELSKLQGDAVMRDAPAVPHTSPKSRGTESTPFWRAWPPSPNHTKNSSTGPHQPVTAITHDQINSTPKQSMPPKGAPTSLAASPKIIEKSANISMQTPTKPNQVHSSIGADNKVNTNPMVNNIVSPRVTNTQQKNADDIAKDKKSTTDRTDGAKVDVSKETPKSNSKDILAADTQKPAAVSEVVAPSDQKTQSARDGITTTGPASGRRSTLQSPTITSKPLPAPSSVKRSSRRSSVAQKQSIDGEVETAVNNLIANEPVVEAPLLAPPPSTPAAAAAASTPAGTSIKERDMITTTENKEEEDDGDSITVASTVPVTSANNTTTTTKKEDTSRDKEREPARTPPRRNTAGRFTRNKSRVG